MLSPSSSPFTPQNFSTGGVATTFRNFLTPLWWLGASAMYRKRNTGTWSTTSCSEAKTKEMVVHFRRKRTTTSPITVMGQAFELADTYRYVLTTIWTRRSIQWKAVSRKGMRRLNFQRRLRSFNVWSKMLKSVVASVTFLKEYILYLLH